MSKVSSSTVHQTHYTSDLIKKAAKARGAGRIVKTDNDAIGRTVIALLESRLGRRQLGRELGRRTDDPWHTNIASELYRYIRRKRNTSPPIGDVCDYQTHSPVSMRKPFLNPTKFAAWLQQAEINHEVLRPIALFACAFAILQPEIGLTLYRMLVDRDPAFVQLIGTPAPGPAAPPASAEPDQKNTMNAKTRGADKSVPQVASEKGQSKDAMPDRMAKLEQTIADLPSYLSPDQLAEAARRLIRLGENHRRHCQKLADVRKRLGERLQEVACLPWLKGPLPGVAIDPLGATRVQEEQLATLERDAEFVLHVHHQLKALCERLSEHPAPFVSAEIGLPAVGEELKRRADDYQARLHEISRREEAVKEFLDGFLNASSDAGVSLLRDADDTRWIDLTAFVLGPEPRTDLGKSCAILVGKVTLLGIAVVGLWPRKPDLVARMLEMAVQHLPSASAGPFNELFRWAPVALLQEVASQQPRLAPAIAQHLFASAVRADHPEELEYLVRLLDAPTLDGSCERLYRTAVEMYRRGVLTKPSQQFAKLTRPEEVPAASDLSQSEQLRGELIEFARLIPRMGPHYYRLRKLVQRKYLEPLVPHIAAGAAAEVRRRWEQYGGLGNMVEECVAESGIRKELDRTHHEETRKYLEHFQDRLLHWEASHQNAAPAEDEGLRTAFRTLQRAAEQGIRQAIGLLGTVLGMQHENVAPLPCDRRCRIQEDVPVLVHMESAITPEMTRSWPAFLEKKPVPVMDLFADMLQRTLAPLTSAQAVEDYLRREKFQAAQRAADGDDILTARVAAELEGRRGRVRAKFANLLHRAEQVRTRDEYIPFCLSEIEKTLEESCFDVCEGLFEALQGMVRRQEILANPERQELLVFLGLPSDDETPLEVLRKRATELRRENQDRRWHLEELRRPREPDSLPIGMLDRLVDLARRSDHPSLWPDAESSFEIAYCLERIFPFITGRLRGGQTDLSARVGDWLCAQWRQFTEGNTEERSQARQALAEMARTIAQYSPDSCILNLLGPVGPEAELLQSRPTERPSQELVAENKTDVILDHAPPHTAINEETGSPETLGALTQVAGSGSASVLKPSVATETAEEFTDRLRRYLRERAEHEPLPDLPSADLGKALRNATRASQWSTARPLAAAAVRELPAEGPLRPAEASFAVALARTATDNPEGTRLAYQYACLAVLLAWEPQPDLLREEVRNLFLARAIAEMYRPVPSDDETAPELADHLRKALKTWSDLPVTDPALRDLARFLQEAVSALGPDGKSGVHHLAEILWDLVKRLHSTDAVACARGDLLELLYRLRQRETLRHLAAQSSQFGDLIILCLNAFNQAESNPTLFADARVYVAAYSDQAAGKPNYRPWLQLFDSLEAGSGADELPLTCEPVSEFVAREQDGAATLQVRVAPSRTDRPSTLRVEFGTAETAGPPHDLLGDEEVLLKEKVFDLRLSPLLVTTASDVLRIPYRLTGQTIRRRRIDLRGTWEVPFTSQVMEPLNEDEILLAWPGADGAPLLSKRGFYGREAQIRKIEKLLCDPHRPRSFMLIGERRIGKTSLLWEMVRAQPPSAGRMSYVYLSVAGLNLKEHRSMARILFDRIVRDLLQDDANRHLQDALRRHGRGRFERALDRPEWLAEKFDPDDSLKIALERLTEWLSEHTDQQVSRLVIFLDEFDKFIEPLLTGRTSDVTKLMWGVREVVQLSTRVGLVLAGSGLLKLLVQGLDKPLHQSIFVLELEPFNRNDISDWKAVGETFLPHPVRKRLCPEHSVESLVEHAAGLCGCHPYYLAMLGYAAALESHGHPLTPAVLNRVIERMIQGRIQATRIDLSRDKFYEGLFTSLERLEARPNALAKVLLVTLARRTTAEMPELPKWHLTETPHANPDLADLTTEEERWQAYRVLLMERALEEDKDKSRVRIRVPLTAAALRHDAVEIRYAALKTLRTSQGDRK